jgi:hypothetical protein
MNDFIGDIFRIEKRNFMYEKKYEESMEIMEEVMFELISQ